MVTADHVHVLELLMVTAKRIPVEEEEDTRKLMMTAE